MEIFTKQQKHNNATEMRNNSPKLESQELLLGQMQSLSSLALPLSPALLSKPLFPPLNFNPVELGLYRSGMPSEINFEVRQF